MAYRTYRTYPTGHMVFGTDNPRNRATGPGSGRRTGGATP